MASKWKCPPADDGEHEKASFCSESASFTKSPPNFQSLGDLAASVVEIALWIVECRLALARAEACTAAFLTFEDGR